MLAKVLWVRNTSDDAAMTGRIDSLIARALQGDAPWQDGIESEAVAARALYHGVAGVLSDYPARIADWPPGLRDRLRGQALSQTMWEMRHKLVVTDLLDRMAERRIPVRVLKGTAFAYGVYPRPGQRARGDSDILIAPGDLHRARAILADAGFSPFLDTGASSASDRLQEVWSMRHLDGSNHEIDLHWAALNSPLLGGVLPVDLAMDRPLPLPSLGCNARTLPSDLALVHASLHRAKHILSPYFVDGVVHYGGDRLIWLMDIDLLWRGLGQQDRENAIRQALAADVGHVVGAALGAARDQLATPVDESVLVTLDTAPAGAAARYLTSDTQAGRAMRDLSASGNGVVRLRYLRNRLFPPKRFMRAKYPAMSRWPLACLYLRRFVGFWKRRQGDGQ